MNPSKDVSFKNLVFNVIYLLAFIVAVMLAKRFIVAILLGYEWDVEIEPEFALPFFITFGFSALFTLVCFIFFLFNNRVAQVLPLNDTTPSSDSYWPWVTLTRRTRRIGFWAILLISLFYLVVFYYDPLQFRDLSSDEKQVENLSALLLFASCIIFIVTGLKVRKIRKNEFIFKFYSMICWAFAVVFFVICMEEIAWMQGVLFFETPEFFASNSQGESNFHNYHTYYFERAYYFSTFIFFVVIPFFYDHRAILARTPLIKHFLPSRFTVYIGAMALAYNFGTWKDVYFQMSFFATLYILVYYAWIKKPDRELFILQSLLVVIFIVSQTSFVLFGYKVLRSSAFLEYKEFYIPLTFLFYSLEINARFKKIIKSVNKQ